MKSINQPLTIGHTWQNPGGVTPALVTAIEQRRLRGYKSGTITHPLWALDYSFMETGLYKVRVKTNAWQARLRRTAHLYPPGQKYWEDTGKARDLHSVYLLFHSKDNGCFRSLVNSRSGYARFHDPAGCLAEAMIQAAAIGHRQGQPGFWEAQSCFYKIIGLLSAALHLEGETYRIRPASEMTGHSLFVQDVESYFREHINTPITITELARHLHMSPSTLAHRYHDETRESPMKTLGRMRINMAKGLLLKGLRLKNIADMLGFADAFHLSKTFKHHEGMAPRDFLKDLAK